MEKKYLSLKKYLVILPLLLIPLLSLSECSIKLKTTHIFCESELGKITVELATSETGTFTLDWPESAIPTTTYIVSQSDLDPITGLFQQDILTVSGLTDNLYGLNITTPAGGFCAAYTIINFIDISPCTGGGVYLSTDPGLCTASFEELNWEEHCGYTIQSNGDTGIPTGQNGGVIINVYLDLDLIRGCSEEFFVLDIEPPRINCPSDINTTISDGACSAPVLWDVTASDNCGVYGINSTCFYPDGSEAPCSSGNEFPLGTTTVESIANDVWGNRTTCTFQITVDNGSSGALILTGDIPNGVHYANQEIISNGNVLSNRNVELRAGQRVRLNEGFNTEADTRLKIRIGDCQPSAPSNLEFVDVDGGTFNMGCTFLGDQHCEPDESPVHTVSVNSFKLSKYEITNEQYAYFMNDVGVEFLGTYGSLNGVNYIYLNLSGIEYNGQNFAPETGRENCPVSSVHWEGAQAFCIWAGGRLPTEAEWEFAARGGNLSQGYSYSGSNIIDDVAWYSANADDIQPVGTKNPNELGLHDMSGNIAEFCNDWYRQDYYSVSPITNPQGPATGNHKVYRNTGLGFYDSDIVVPYTVWKRNRHWTNSGSYYIGFRCAKDF